MTAWQEDYSADLDVDGRMVLKWILSKVGGSCGLDSSDSE
jgi:hypothetical protein